MWLWDNKIKSNNIEHMLPEDLSHLSQWIFICLYYHADLSYMRELFALNLCSWQLFVFKNIYERISLSALRFFSKDICNTTKVNLHENKFFFLNIIVSHYCLVRTWMFQIQLISTLCISTRIYKKVFMYNVRTADVTCETQKPTSLSTLSKVNYLNK